jgi:hypothetical protein
MKKIIIAVVVILAGSLIGLKYFAAKKQAGMPPSPVAMQPQPEQQGVALPPGSTGYGAPVESAASFTPTQATGSYALLALPPAAANIKGACEGGSPKEIFENHGKTWGYETGKRNAFEPKKSQEIYNYVWEYNACLAAARRDGTVCSELPGDIAKDPSMFGVPMNTELGFYYSPSAICRNRSVMLLFKAYVAGITDDQQNCTNFISEWDASNQARISPTEFCGAAVKGPEKLLAYGKEKMPDIAVQSEKAMAFSRKVCGSDSTCLSEADLWEGIKTRNADKCPASYKPNCAALIQKSPSPCAVILSEMSKKYCVYHKALLKAGGGFAGVTPEEVQEKLRLDAEKKKEEEMLRKQQDTANKQVNENVRKLIGTKGEKGE